MKKFVLALAFLLPSLLHAQCTGSSPTWSTTTDLASVQTCVTNASPGDTINIAAGSVTWTGTLTISKGITLKGNGTPNNTPGTFGSGTLNTTIIDNNLTGPIIVTPVGGIPQGQTLRISSLKIQPISSTTVLQSPVQIVGACNGFGCAQVRIDNINFAGWNNSNGQNQGNGAGSWLIRIDGFYGVIDHNNTNQNLTGYSGNLANVHFSSWLGVGVYGDNSWASADTFGTTSALYFENNQFMAGTYDCDVGTPLGLTGGGCRTVVRFNQYTITQGNAISYYHGTDTTQRQRGGRQAEVYGNTVSWGTVATDTATEFRSGVGLIFGNSASFTTTVNQWAKLDPQRRWRGNIPPFGPCDGSSVWDQNDAGNPFVTGRTIGNYNSSTLVLTDSGSPGWTTNQWFLNGSPWSVHDTTVGAGLEIVSNTASTLTLLNPGGGQGTQMAAGQGYQIDRALVCLDQPARSGGTLVQNSGGLPVLSTTGLPGSPNEVLDPTYLWMNTTLPASKPNATATTNSIIRNRDWYDDNFAGVQTSPTSPFNGATGVGWGLKANRPSTCTTGVAYWATNEGTWNTSGNSFGQGNLYKCTATDTWTLSYTPLTYPHPLISGVTAVDPPTFSPIAGTYPASQSVSLSDTAGATICYRTDGVAPTAPTPGTCGAGSTTYSTPISVTTTNTTIQALGTKSGLTNSTVASATYVLQGSAPTFNPVGGTYAATQNVSLSQAQSLNSCITTNGTTPASTGIGTCSNGVLNTGSVINVSTSQTLKAVAINSGWTDSAVATAVYVIAPVAGTPSATPGSGTYSGTQSVILSVAGGAPTICYTVDGVTNPQTNGGTGCTRGTKYTVAISISANTQLRAVAGGTGFQDGSIATFTYTINSVAVAPALSPGTGTYPSAQSVTMTSTSVGAHICYTNNGTTPVTSAAACVNGTLYSGPVSVSVATTLKAVAGGVGYTDSSITTAVYSFQAATPTAAPGQGTYSSAQSVVLTTSSGSVLCYSTNGTTIPATNNSTGCASGTLYTGPVSVATSLVLKVVAGGAGFVDSAVASFTYTITATPPSAPKIILLTKTSNGANFTVKAQWSDTPTTSIMYSLWIPGGRVVATGVQVTDSTGNGSGVFGFKAKPGTGLNFCCCDPANSCSCQSI